MPNKKCLKLRQKCHKLLKKELNFIQNLPKRTKNNLRLKCNKSFNKAWKKFKKQQTKYGWDQVHFNHYKIFKQHIAPFMNIK